MTRNRRLLLPPAMQTAGRHQHGGRTSLDWDLYRGQPGLPAEPWHAHGHPHQRVGAPSPLILAAARSGQTDEVFVHADQRPLRSWRTGITARHLPALRRLDAARHGSALATWRGGDDRPSANGQSLISRVLMPPAYR